MIFQEPMVSLNPVHTIGQQITEILRRHTSLSSREARARALELLDMVAIADAKNKIDAYPHELSGGQRQRVMIAIATALRPRLLIADEPTTALDAIVQRQIMKLLDTLRRELDMALLLISHDVPIVTEWTDRVIVMHHGRQIEELEAKDLKAEARHPYTRGLIGASLNAGDHRHYRHDRLPEIHALRGSDGDYIFELATPPAARSSVGTLQPQPPLVEARKLDLRYRNGYHALKDVSFELKSGETLGLVGESGCGKSTLARALIGLARIDSGELSMDGKPLQSLSHREWKPWRAQAQLVFQDPWASLNQRHTVKTILRNVLYAHGITDKAQQAKRIVEVLEIVRLPHDSLSRLPHQLSGGQRQRVAIARALILQPRLLICDEPVSALDVSVQAQILNRLSDLKTELGLTMLFISHDIGVIRYIADRVMVMEKGEIVEVTSTDELSRPGHHPYTTRLIDAQPGQS
jgi:peptide/nickel transport system ATP-binding protein